MDWCSGSVISKIKYATYFSEANSISVLLENVDHVLALSKLIKLAFLVKFNEEALDFLMESKDCRLSVKMRHSSILLSQLTRWGFLLFCVPSNSI
ncbi:unnamed protein product [Sphenostylis stenocarpa]|uniref:Uncharacterized protein n=1 Tax=Sphenostylis stenocarpa TaxID=92480 RepID=A0AA86SDK1_9FABA|nr:unnamed protein product [Sphenostylis stenocarpa]